MSTRERVSEDADASVSGRGPCGGDVESRSGVVEGGRVGVVEAPEPPLKIVKGESDLRLWARAWAESFPAWSDERWRRVNAGLGYRPGEPVDDGE
jgi:hypothetical protein